MLNTKKNFDFIVENWSKLVKFSSLTLYLVNPFSNLDKKWIINPHVHHKICDDNSLRTGLRSMFDTVEALSEADIKDKFR